MKIFLFYTILIPMLCACGTSRWYSVEQKPAESIAFLNDGVYVRGDYVQMASILELNNNKVGRVNNSEIKIDVGEHKVLVACDEARGEFNTTEIEGKTRLLVFEAQAQRSYRVKCKPFTHWWIEDIESGKVVAGQMPAS